MTYEELNNEADHLIAIAQSGTLEQSTIQREVIDKLIEIHFNAKQQVYSEWMESIRTKITSMNSEVTNGPR